MPLMGTLRLVELSRFRWILIAMLLPLGCSTSKSDLGVSIDPTSSARLEGLPGAIGITLRDYGDTQVREKSYEISRGRIVEVRGLPAAPKQSYSAGVGPDGATMLPRDGEFIYAGPYLTSPDKTRVVASVAFKKSRWMLPTSYVVGDLTRKELISVHRDEERLVEAIAWSPDSKFVALLRQKQASVLHGPMEIVSSCAGHPVQYFDYYLEVINAAGRQIVSTKILGPIAGSWGELVWRPKASNSTVETDARKSGARGSP